MLHSDPTTETAAPLSPIDQLIADARPDAVLAAVASELTPMLTRTIAKVIESDRLETRHRAERGEDPLDVNTAAAMASRATLRELSQAVGRFGPESGRRVLRQAAARETVALVRSFITTANLGPQLESYPERLLSRWWRQQCGFDRLQSRGQESRTGLPSPPGQMSESEVPTPTEESHQ